MFLKWDEINGLALSNDAQGSFAKCVISSYQSLDKKPVFMILDSQESTLGNPGNNNVYDSYYFKKSQLVLNRNQRLHQDLIIIIKRKLKEIFIQVFLKIMVIMQQNLQSKWL